MFVICLLSFLLPPMPPLKYPLDKQKKPRHRHSAVQLAALNHLYELTDHPPLHQRMALAQSLGLETKSVNAWFQNKRASTKKQPRGAPYEVPSPPSVLSSHISPHTDIDDDYYLPVDSVTRNQHFRSQPLDFDHRRIRNQYSVPTNPHTQLDPTDFQLSVRQIEELRRIYTINRHPTSDETRVIANRTGLHYQTIVGWFQTQRSLDKTKIEDNYHTTSLSPVFDQDGSYSRVYSAFAPVPGLPPASSHPSLVALDSGRRSSVVTSVHHEHLTSIRNQRSLSPRDITPYGSTSTAISLSARQRRGRPDTFQLHNLKRLLNKTPTPSIEERSALALEIGMWVVIFRPPLWY
ncbi:hypothetical protein B0H10DRAFT_823449 [Mycena sp. CBHHK59/15]|nr:hypothetical protein B0H10DRAFT_823449 [Mycena sp. CBHHK59/15]